MFLRRWSPATSQVGLPYGLDPGVVAASWLLGGATLLVPGWGGLCVEETRCAPVDGGTVHLQKTAGGVVSMNEPDSESAWGSFVSGAPCDDVGGCWVREFPLDGASWVPLGFAKPVSSWVVW